MKSRKTSHLITLNKKSVESLESPDDGSKVIWDSNLKGFGLRISDKGSKTYFIVYRNRYKRQVKKSIGRHGDISAVEARRRAKKLLGAVAAEADPYRNRQEPTFEVLAEEYIKRRCSQKKSGKEDERIIRKDLLPSLKKFRIDEISRLDLSHIACEIMDERNSPVMANRTIEVASRVFNFGIKSGLIENNINPAFKAEKPYKEPRGRSRVLTIAEIKTFWRILEELNTSSPLVCSALKLILVTAQRPGEIAAMEWSNIDLKEGIWIIPGMKTKNGREHLVPMSTLAKKILHQLPRMEKHVFPSPINNNAENETHIQTNALALTLRRQRKRKAFGTIDRFTPHDLRRSGASHLGRLGHSLIVSKILNHVPRNITETRYNLYDFKKEKREALESWGREIERIIAGDEKGKVLPINL